MAQPRNHGLTIGTSKATRPKSSHSSLSCRNTLLIIGDRLFEELLFLFALDWLSLLWGMRALAKGKGGCLRLRPAPALLLALPVSPLPAVSPPPHSKLSFIQLGSKDRPQRKQIIAGSSDSGVPRPRRQAEERRHNGPLCLAVGSVLAPAAPMFWCSLLFSSGFFFQLT